METIIFATNNAFKLQEIQQIINPYFLIKGLQDIGCTEELPENQNTIEGNAIEKALYVYKKYKKPCFADDTGLEIEALKGAPGVYSARFAGANATFDDNTKKVLELLHNEKNRKARFRTIIALLYNDRQHLFEGRVEGEITFERRGHKGFGYDPIFQPSGYKKTFAEMSSEEKNAISHRGKASQALVNFLSSIK